MAVDVFELVIAGFWRFPKSWKYPKIAQIDSKWMVSIGKSDLNEWFGVTPILGNLHCLIKRYVCLLTRYRCLWCVVQGYCDCYQCLFSIGMYWCDHHLHSLVFLLRLLVRLLISWELWCQGPPPTPVASGQSTPPKSQPTVSWQCGTILMVDNRTNVPI